MPNYPEASSTIQLGIDATRAKRASATQSGKLACVTRDQFTADGVRKHIFVGAPIPAFSLITSIVIRPIGKTTTAASLTATKFAILYSTDGSVPTSTTFGELSASGTTGSPLVYEPANQAQQDITEDTLIIVYPSRIITSGKVISVEINYIKN